MDASTSTVQAPQKQAASQKAEQTNETTTLGFWKRSLESYVANTRSGPARALRATKPPKYKQQTDQ